MAYYDQYFSDYAQIQTPPVVNVQSTQQIVRRRMMLILVMVLFLIVPLLVSLRPRVTAVNGEQIGIAAAPAAEVAGEAVQQEIAAVPAAPTGVLSPVFTPEVRHWEPQI